MAGLLSPIDNPQAWDVVKVGNTVSPGICMLSGFSRDNDFDKKKGKGTIGATLTFTGKPPVEGTIKFILWDNGKVGGTGHDHFAEWSAFVPLLKYDPTKKTITAVDVFHPSLANIDATSFVCTKLGAVVQEGDPGQGLYSVTISLCEYHTPPKKSAVGTPTTSKSNATSGANANTASAQDAQQAEIAALMAQASSP